MGAPRITVEAKETFWEAIRNGASRRTAARIAGFSESSAKNLLKQPANGNDYRELRAQRDIPETPLRPDEWCEAAIEALEDPTGYLFAKRYAGWELSPFQQTVFRHCGELYAETDRSFACLNGPPGTGKALALDTPLATPSGWTTMKDVQVGDEVFDENGRPCRVTAKSEVFYDHDCFEVRTDDGATVIADADHLWSVRLHGFGQYGGAVVPDYAGKTGPKPKTVDGRATKTTRFLAQPRSKRAQLQMAAPLDTPESRLLIDPYVLGAWLGDGTSAGAGFTCNDPQIIDEIRAAGEPVKHHAGMRYSITDGTLTGRGFAPRKLTSRLRHLNLLNNKHVPEVYFRASPAQRLSLLQGLIDTDGYVDPKGCVEFVSTNLRLAEAVQRLVWSLGAKAGLAVGRATLNGRDCGPKYRVTFYLANAARLARKAVRCRNGVRTTNRYLTVTPVESVATQCIQVDSPSHLFLAGDGLLVTHNSTGFVLFAAKQTVLDRTIRGMFLSGASSLAVKNTRRVRMLLSRAGPMIDAATTLSADFGRFKPRSGGDVWKADEFTVLQMDGDLTEEKEATWTAFGFDSLWVGNRLNIVFGDDIDSTRTIRNLEIVEGNREIFDNELEPRLEPGGLFIVGQQRLGAFDTSAHVLAKTLLPDDDDGETDQPEGVRKYRHLIYKVHYDEICAGLTVEERKAMHRVDAPAYPDGCLLDPRRISWRDVRTAQRNPRTYKVVYQQEDPGEDDALVQRLWVDGGLGADGVSYIGCWDKDRGMWELPRRGDGVLGLEGPCFGVVTVDPSPTKYWSVQAWVMHPASNQRFLLEQHRERMEAPDFLDWSQNMNSFTGLAEDWWHMFQRVGVPMSHLIVERNAAQRFMLQYDFFHRWRQLRRVALIPHDTARNKADPEYGVQMIGPVWRDGLVRLPGRGQGRISSIRLVDEVLRYPHSTTTDCLMGQWFLEYNLVMLTKKNRTRKRVSADPRRPSWAA